MAAAKTRNNGATTQPPVHVVYRRARDMAGLSVLHPDWPPAPPRRSGIALVLHVDAPERADAYLDLVVAAAGHLDLFVMVPEGVEDTGWTPPAAFTGSVEVLEADAVAGGLYQLTSLLNSERATGYRTVVRHWDDGAEALDRFVRLIEGGGIAGLDSAIHSDLSLGGYYVGNAESAEGTTLVEGRDRVLQLMLRVSTRVPRKEAVLDHRGIDTIALRGAVLEALRTFRIDHQDFYFTYTHYLNEGLATEYMGGTEHDEDVADAIRVAFLTLVDYAHMRIEPAEVVDAPVPGTEPGLAVARRARAWATYFPDLTSSSSTRDASWTHIASTPHMFFGQHLPVAPGTLSFPDPLSVADRAAQANLAAESGIEGFLVLAEWNEQGLQPATFFAGLRDDTTFPWAIVLRHPVTRRTDPAGNYARSTVWQDPGSAFYGALAAQLAELAVSPAYLRVEGRPVVVLENVELLEDVDAFVASVRSAVTAASGTNPWIGVGETWAATVRPGETTMPEGFDGRVQASHDAYHERFHTNLDGRTNGFGGPAVNLALTYQESSTVIEARSNDAIVPGAIVGFDTSPVLRSQGIVGYNWNLMTFRRMLENAVAAVAAREEDRRIVVVSSWNGWSELSQLEPGDYRGSAYLSTVRDVLFR